MSSFKVKVFFKDKTQQNNKNNKNKFIYKYIKNKYIKIMITFLLDR